MKSPQHERADLLRVAIDRAGEVLEAPIDRVVVGPFRITCWAGRRKIRMAYRYAQGGAMDHRTGTFMPMPGSGSWDVIVEQQAASVLFRALRRIFARHPS